MVTTGSSKFGQVNRRKFLLGLAGLGLVSWRLPEAKAYQPFEPFKLAYVTDVHLINGVPDSYLLLHESQLFLQELVKDLELEKPDFIMFGGDNVHTLGKESANWNLFLDCLTSLTVPWAFVLGERDISGDYSIDKVRTYGTDWKDRGIQTTTSYWSLNPPSIPNVHLIGLDTSIPNTTVGGMSQRQLDWLKDDLEDNKRSFTMIFSHHPLLPPPPFDSGPPWDDYVIPDSGTAREIIGSYPNVKMVVSGHVHVSKVQSERDVWHISSPSLSCWPCAYRMFTVSPEEVTMETRQIGFPALIKKARKALADSALADKFSRSDPESFLDIVGGDRLDRAAIIPMRAGHSLEPYSPGKMHKQPEHTEQSKEESAPTHHRQGLFHNKKSSPAKPDNNQAPAKSAQSGKPVESRQPLELGKPTENIKSPQSSKSATTKKNERASKASTKVSNPAGSSKLSGPDHSTTLITPDEPAKLNTPEPPTRLSVPESPTTVSTPDQPMKLPSPEPAKKPTEPDPLTKLLHASKTNSSAKQSELVKPLKPIKLPKPKPPKSMKLPDSTESAKAAESKSIFVDRPSVEPPKKESHF